MKEIKRRLTLAIVLAMAVVLSGAACVSAKPEGSILNHSMEFSNSPLLTKYMNITVLVQNVGGDGAFYVNAVITPPDAVVQGDPVISTKVYLKQSETKVLVFKFKVLTNKLPTYDVSCD